MSVYIPGVEMPESCRKCFFQINCDDCEGYECLCAVLNRKIGYLSEVPTDFRLDDCPLVPVPEYGRLIDADALMHEFEKAQRTMEQHGREYSCSFMSSSQEISTEWYCVEDMLENAPTIIPANKEGE